MTSVIGLFGKFCADTMGTLNANNAEKMLPKSTILTSDLHMGFLLLNELKGNGFLTSVQARLRLQSLRAAGLSISSPAANSMPSEMGR